MRLNIIWLCLIIILFYSCNLEVIPPEGSQNNNSNQITFSTTIGGNANDFPRDLIVNADGTYVIVGYSQSFTASNDNQAYIVKLDAEGKVSWENNFGGSADDFAQAVIRTSDGGYIFCGNTRSFNPSNTDDLYLVKVNAQGNKVWEKNYGSPDSTEVAFGIVASSTSDNYIVGYKASDGSSQIKLMYINDNGARLSTKLIRNGSMSPQKMIRTVGGDIILAGYEFIPSKGTVSYIYKVDEEGNYIWENTFPEQVSNYTPSYAVIELSNQNLLAAGSDLGSNDHDFNLLNYNSIGALQWDELWGGANADELLDVCESLDNEIVVMGYSRSFSNKTEIYISKRKATDGTLIWEQNMEEIWNLDGDIEACPDGGFIVCSGQNAANADIIVIKTNVDGEVK